MANNMQSSIHVFAVVLNFVARFLHHFEKVASSVSWSTVSVNAFFIFSRLALFVNIPTRENLGADESVFKIAIIFSVNSTE